MTRVPLSSSLTLVALAMSGQRLSDRHERSRALALELGDPLGGVLEEAAAGLDAQMPLLLERRRGTRHARLVGQRRVQVAGDACVDVETGHVQQDRKSVV